MIRSLNYSYNRNNWVLAQDIELVFADSTEVSPSLLFDLLKIGSIAEHIFKAVILLPLYDLSFLVLPWGTRNFKNADTYQVYLDI